jgi:hypothetical protein
MKEPIKLESVKFLDVNVPPVSKSLKSIVIDESDIGKQTMRTLEIPKELLERGKVKIFHFNVKDCKF